MAVCGVLRLNVTRFSGVASHVKHILNGAQTFQMVAVSIPVNFRM